MPKVETFNCECIDCGHKMESEKHCKDIKCPKCGGQMRREERPGPGQDNKEGEKDMNMKQGIFMREIKAESKQAVIDVIGVIGWEVYYPEMRDMIKSVPDAIEDVIFEIYSPGGSVWEGNAIIQAIGEMKQHTTAHIQLAASMATLIAVACDDRSMAANGRFLVHFPFAGLEGDAEAMEKRAKELRDCEKEMSAFYSQRTGQKEEDITKLMSEERWLTADESKEMGFIQTINDPFDKAAFDSVRSEIQASGKWPVALINKEENKNDADTAGSKKKTDGESGIPDKPTGETETSEHSEDYKAGIADGDAQAAVRVAAESAEMLAENKKEIEKKDGLLSKMQGERDSGLARIATLQDSLKESKEKMDKLLAGGMTFAADIETWEKAMSASGGDYTEARRTYPEVYKMERARAKENRKKGGSVMKKVGIFLAVMLAGSLSYGALTEVESFQFPNLVDEINAGFGEVDILVAANITSITSEVARATIAEGLLASKSDVWGAPKATGSTNDLVNTVAIQAQTVAGGDLKEPQLIRVWVSETSLGAASTNNIETLVLSTGTAVDTITANADYRYVTATNGSAVATITATAAGTNYIMVADGSSVSATAILFW